MAGRKPKPTKLKLLAGNPGKRPLNDKEPEPPRGIPRCPKHITGRSKEAWKQLAPLLDRMGVLTHADATALELVCDAYADYRDAKKVVDAGGPVYTTTTQQGDTMYRPRPEVAMRDGAWKRVLDVLRDFGCTPSSRSKVTVEAEREDDEARFFGSA